MSTASPIKMDAQVAKDVERGLALLAELEPLEAELKAIEGRLAEAARNGEQIDLADEELEGKQYLARSSRHVVPIILTSDLLVQSFEDQSKNHGQVIRALGKRATKLLPLFYRKVVSFKIATKNGKAFRACAEEFLGAAAPEFITICKQKDKHGIPKSAVKINWDKVADAE